MALIVGIHGIGQQYKGENVLRAVWLPALKDGLNRAGLRLDDGVDIACAFYGDLFRPKGTKGTEDPPYSALDVDDPFEQELLSAWAREAERIEDGAGLDGTTKGGRTPRTTQWALNVLSASRFFVGLTQRAMVADLKQVRTYLNNSSIREQVQTRVAEAVSPETRVMIGHSLGSVVAYEALCAHPEWPVRTFVSLGSPLGIRNLIFDQLRPPPRDGCGAWPGRLERWTNVADGGDVVALIKQLGPCFDARIRDELIHNGATSHDVAPYLTAKETGHAIAAGLDR